MRIKCRIKYGRAKTPYDGYRYFGLTDDEFKKYKAQIGKTGKRRKKITFENIECYKVKEECLISPNFKHFFRVPIADEKGYSIHFDKLETRDYEYL